MSIMTSPYKHPQTGVYYFRMAVPKALVPLIGKTVFKTSLRTKNLREAKAVFAEHLIEAQKQLELARLKLNSSPDIELSKRDCAIISERWYELARERVERTGAYEEVLYLERSLSGLEASVGIRDELSISHLATEEITEQDLRQLAVELKPIIDKQLEREGLVVSVESPSYVMLAKAFYRYMGKLESLSSARQRNDFGYEPVTSPIADRTLSIPSRATQRSKPTLASENTISTIFERYRVSAELNEKDAKTLSETQLQIERFIEIIGDVDISSVKRVHIAEFRDTLLQLPKSKAKEIRSKPLERQLELARKQSLPTISSTTVKNAMRKLSVVFSHAVELGFLENNPMFGVSVNTSKKMVEVGESKGYSPEDIKRLFKYQLFRDVNTPKPYGMACYWIPLLCRYTGARLEEMAQLRKSDIVTSEESIHFLNIRRGEGQRVKTNSSLRHIPIHTHLIELGFLEYVASGTDQLFPQLKTNKYGVKSSAFSKWWSQTVKKVGISIDQPSHAFRHAFKTSMRGLEVADTVSDAITGHTPNSVGGSYGTVDLNIKKAAIDKLPRLDIERIYFNSLK
ncbi:TPA: site-specific integrase [Vibrio parahaemolyticus]|nr:site-specific integrase [Vibrio parahaemolyticus]